MWKKKVLSLIIKNKYYESLSLSYFHNTYNKTIAFTPTHTQDAFDNVPDSYKEELTADMKTGLHAALYHTTVSTFMTELYDCIVLNITAPPPKQEEGEKDDTKNHGYP